MSESPKAVKRRQVSLVATPAPSGGVVFWADPEVGGQVEVVQRLNEQEGLLLHRHSVHRYGAELVENKNAAHQAGLEEAAKVLDEPGRPDLLMKRADEYADRRNHPISRALHGRLAPVNGEWHVPVAEVQAWARLLGKRVSGIVWRLEGSEYVGGSYPAHFNDRGRMTPWRASWGDSGAIPPPSASGLIIRRSKQDNHIVGKNHDGRRSILTEPPEYLAQWAGTGESANGVPIGGPGCRERVDFGFVIGTYYELDEDKVKSRRPTTVGMIH